MRSKVSLIHLDHVFSQKHGTTLRLPMIEQKYTSKADIFALNSFTVFETKDRVVCRGSMVITKDAVLWNQ